MTGKTPDIYRIELCDSAEPGIVTRKLVTAGAYVSGSQESTRTLFAACATNEIGRRVEQYLLKSLSRMEERSVKSFALQQNNNG